MELFWLYFPSRARVPASTSVSVTAVPNPLANSLPITLSAPNFFRLLASVLFIELRGIVWLSPPSAR